MTERKQSSIEHKPGFDARTAYYNTLEKFLGAYYEYKVSIDLNGQLRALSGIFMLVSPYIKAHCRDELQKLFDSIQNNLSIDNRVSINSASRKLNKLAFELFRDAKHVFLPVDSDDLTEEIDWESFMTDD